MTRSVPLPWSKRPKKNKDGSNRETTEVMTPIRELCRKIHVRCERNNTGRGRGMQGGIVHLHSEGFWDLTVFDAPYGMTVMVECKVPGEELEPAQKAWMEIYHRCGLKTIVATSPEEFLDRLQKLRVKAVT